MAARLGACFLPTSINLTLHGIIVSEKCLMHVGAKVLNRCYLLRYYACFITRKPEKIDFFIIRVRLSSSNIVLRVVCRLHLYEAQRLFSVYHVFPRHTGNVDIKSGLALLAYSDFNFIVFLLIFLL